MARLVPKLSDRTVRRYSLGILGPCVFCPEGSGEKEKRSRLPYWTNKVKAGIIISH
jgi:hypothetical protein